MTAQISAGSVPSITHNANPVVTTEFLAHLYGTEAARIRKNHQRNSARFIDGKHFYKITGVALDDLRVSLRHSQNPISPKVRSLILWTERGAARHAKMLETDLAWEVFEQLEDCYFNQRAGVEQTTTYSRTPLRDAVNMLVGKKGMMYPDAYSLIHQRFGVQHIDQLSQSQMLEAIEYIHCLLIDDRRPDAVPMNGRILTTFHNGEMVGQRFVRDDEHVATLPAFMEMAKKARYLLVHEDDAAPLLRALTGGEPERRRQLLRQF
ncbi:ORF6N domain-containing protein [Serratia sp. IR-2025]